jgi:hypothetical protein
MTNQIQTDYKALHAAAITLGTRMLAQIDQVQLDLLEMYSKQGAKLIMEIDLPNCEKVNIVLVELEGTRHPVFMVGKSHD